MTPVMLAALKNNYDILKMLLQAGFPRPETDAYQWTLSISQAQAWLDAYRAVCSPFYILLTSTDPFRTAFRTAKALRDVCWKREQYRPELERLADQCETLACELLEEVRSNEELDILGHTDDPEGRPDELVGTLQLAVDLKQRQFVTQPLCVEYIMHSRLTEVFDFHEVFRNWEKKPVIYAALWGLAIQLSYPLLCLAYIIAPDSKIGRFSRLYFVREYCWNMSWFMFMALLLIETQYYQVGAVEVDSIVQGTPLRVPYIELSVSQMFIMLWVASIFLEELHEVRLEGFGRYFRQFWNILDFTLVALYLAQLALRFVAQARLDVYSEDTVATVWMTKAKPDIFRPVAVADAIFSLFTIAVFMRSVSIFGHNRYLGTLMISIGRMFADIVNFLSMSGLVAFAFASGLNQLYWYYGTVHDYLCEKYSKSNLKTVGCQASHGFSTLFKTLESLFWATFGISDLSMLELDPDNNTLEALRIHEQPVLTEAVGKLIFAMFHVMVVLVLLNLLIAIMSDSYQRTQDDKRRDWTFAIVQHTMFSLRVDLSLAPPFNLLLLLKNGVSWLLCALCRRGNRRSPHTAGQGSVHPPSPSQQERQEKYKMIIDRLVNRYLLRKERQMEDQG
ncbi:short transient receptor potential channel 4-like [Branchiostoma lanceolatum]|uniref:short transient receptor potential channel 4-like n=1 Tax=Branchiostoma lanceolatum TaxID=7740 RepID=UPI003452B5F4